MNFLGLTLWLLIAYALLFFLRFSLAGQFVGLSLLLTRHAQPGRILFNLLLFPGVLVHELSHFFMAATLGVPTGEITIFPHQDQGEKHLGSVKIAHTDPLRESLIGAAPLLVSSLLLVALSRWQFPTLFASNLSLISPLNLLTNLYAKLQSPLTWLWFYLTFTIANTMFTSQSDRRAWPFIVGLVLMLIVFFSALNLVQSLGAIILEASTQVISELNIAFTLTIAVDLFLLSFLTLLSRVVSWITGRKLASW
ncbi:MAG: hypothetical protein HY381_01985 [Candidatus Chisholmbacteria bacterium]|nr:hypothetical protein [Candidatus Chisholmbacteria bacterium]